MWHTIPPLCHLPLLYSMPPTLHRLCLPLLLDPESAQGQVKKHQKHATTTTQLNPNSFCNRSTALLCSLLCSVAPPHPPPPICQPLPTQPTVKKSSHTTWNKLNPKIVMMLPTTYSLTPSLRFPNPTTQPKKAIISHCSVGSVLNPIRWVSLPSTSTPKKMIQCQLQTLFPVSHRNAPTKFLTPT